MHYSLNLQWSKQKQAYLVTVPELPGCTALGKTRKEAVKNVQKAINLWIENACAHNETIPSPQLYASIGED